MTAQENIKFEQLYLFEPDPVAMINRKVNEQEESLSKLRKRHFAAVAALEARLRFLEEERGKNIHLDHG